MSLIDLSLVTSGLMKLLDDNINKNIDAGANVTVTAEPPDKVGSVTNKLSLYMYHVAEEAHYKNMLGPGSDARNVARTPMGLCLFYILTAHHESSEPEFDPLTQQRLMGYALKTLHDYPILHDGTIIDQQQILPPGLLGQDNPVQVIMRPTAPEDAVAFWGSEDQQTARLSAYYEVRVILLEPEEPSTAAAPVLSLGTYLYQLGTAHLESSKSSLPFVLPAAAGGFTQVVEASPARVSTDPIDPIHNRVILTGQNLLTGKRRQIWLRCERWSSTELLNWTPGPLPVDLEIGNNVTEGWALTASETELILDIADQLHFYNDNGGAESFAVYPGIYTAFVRTVIDERVVAGVLTPITSDSNEIGFTVIPRIDSTNTIGIQRIEITIVNTFALDDPKVDLRLFIAGKAYVEVLSLLPLVDEDEVAQKGLFEVTSSTKLTVQALFPTGTAGDYAVRLIVNGAESAPYWIQIS